MQSAGFRAAAVVVALRGGNRAFGEAVAAHGAPGPAGRSADPAIPRSRPRPISTGYSAGHGTGRGPFLAQKTRLVKKGQTNRVPIRELANQVAEVFIRALVGNAPLTVAPGFLAPGRMQHLVSLVSLLP